jgi:mRNA-degrading endonuclease RelE of RelBE toxin-antitoxin system
MEARIIISARAVKQLKKLSADMRSRILRTIRELENWPDVRNVKALQGIKGFRLRSGRYRILFDVDELGMILVAEILIRNESTYQEKS